MQKLLNKIQKLYDDAGYKIVSGWELSKALQIMTANSETWNGRS